MRAVSCGALLGAFPKPRSTALCSLQITRLKSRGDLLWLPHQPPFDISFLTRCYWIGWEDGKHTHPFKFLCLQRNWQSLSRRSNYTPCQTSLLTKKVVISRTREQSLQQSGLQLRTARPISSTSDNAVSRPLYIRRLLFACGKATPNTNLQSTSHSTQDIQKLFPPAQSEPFFLPPISYSFEVRAPLLLLKSTNGLEELTWLSFSHLQS